MSQVRFQLLWHEFVVTTPSRDVDDALAYVVQHAQHDTTPLEIVRLDVTAATDGFDVANGSGNAAHADDLLALVDVVYEQVHTAAFTHASHHGWVRAHAAVVEVDGTRIALAGPSGVGKTTLALRLLFDGAAVQGDESVVLRDGVALPVARPFHLKEGVGDVVTEVAPMLASLPTLPISPLVRAFHPDRIGPWSVTARPIDHVVLVERAERSALASTESTQVMHDLVESVFWMHESKSTIVREIASVLQSARCHRLAVGDVADASRLVQGLGR